MFLLSFLVFFALYAGAAAPSFTTDGGAELLAAAAAGGVPPPPAQSLSWILARAALWVPFGNPAYRLNLLAAALMAGTVPLVAGLLEAAGPAPAWAPSASQELEQDRWRATARWLTAFLWGLSPGPWRCALSFGPDTIGLFLIVCAFFSAGRPPAREGAFPRTTFLAALAAGQWPAAAWALPGLGFWTAACRDRRAGHPTLRRILSHAMAATLGLAPGLLILLLSRAAPPLDHGSPDTWVRWARHAATIQPFFPPASAWARNDLWGPAARFLAAAYSWPGMLLWLFGLQRLARNRPDLLHAVLWTALLPGPFLLLWARPAPALDDPAQAAAWGMTALGLSAAFLWGYHRAGVRWPAARTALAVLLPLSLAGRLPSAARDEAPLRDRAANLLKALPAGSLLWDPASPGGVFHARFVEGIRPDVRVARAPRTDWGRAEFRRRRPAPGHPSALLLSPDLFFLDTARDTGPESVFTDDARRLPEVDPATGLGIDPRMPEDALPLGMAFQFLPSETHRLVAPAAQLSVARVPFWAARAGDPEGLARARMDLSRKFDQYGLSRDAEEEALAALAQDPLDPAAHRRLGAADMGRRDPARATAHFRRALLRGPQDASAWESLAGAEEAMGDVPAAVRAARRALDLEPSLDGTRRALAELLERQGRWRPAADQWRALMDRDPREASYVWRLAKAEASAGRPAQARAALREYLLFPLSDEEKGQAEAMESALERSR